LTTKENLVIGFVALKDLYASNNDFWEIVEQLKNPIIGNMDLSRGEYFIQDSYLFKGKKYAFQLVLRGKMLSENFTIVVW
jgi:hypothetical protein